MAMLTIPSYLHLTYPNEGVHGGLVQAASILQGMTSNKYQSSTLAYSPCRRINLHANLIIFDMIEGVTCKISKMSYGLLAEDLDYKSTDLLVEELLSTNSPTLTSNPIDPPS
jgi:hypothetical protein